MNIVDELDSVVTKDILVNLFLNGMFEVLAEKIDEKRLGERVLDDLGSEEGEAALLTCCRIGSLAEAALIKSGRSWILKPRTAKSVTVVSKQAQQSSYSQENKPWSRSRPQNNYVVSPSIPVSAPRGSITTSQRPAGNQSTEKGAERRGSCFKCGGPHLVRACPNRHGGRPSLNMFDCLGDEEEVSDQENAAKGPNDRELSKK